MKKSEISLLRLQNQKILKTGFRKAEEIVKWMGAMQAQDFIMAQWAVGTRLMDPAVRDIENALKKGAVLRTHLMRPTWHFVSANDIYWLLELTAPRIRSSLRSRQKYLEISADLILKVNRLLTKVLEKEGALTREDLVVLFMNAGIRTDENRFSHLMLSAELDGIVCSGPMKKGKQTYALLPDRVPRIKRLSHEEALAELTKRYFTSHGPATVKDFAWWSGLSAADIKKGIESVRNHLDSEIIGTEKYWFKEPALDSDITDKTVFLLPAYDEFLISYADRSHSLSLTEKVRTVSVNGIFRPVIVVNGQIAGIWRRQKVKDNVQIELSFFRPCTKPIRILAHQAAERYGKFLGIVPDVKIVY